MAWGAGDDSPQPLGTEITTCTLVTVADVSEIVDGLVTGQPVKRLVVTADQHD
jgi:hypothetical protein